MEKFDLEKVMFPVEYNPADIAWLAEEIKRAISEDPILQEYKEIEKALDLAPGPNYTPTVSFQYTLSSA
ncbi:MAG: hypothetical protein HY694_10025 [Deltaproteobacteria bacterium]|nr:hypothetical protein [Deltaproteobacteria bacterium]